MVSGDARVNGTLYAQGLVLATKMQADTVKSTSTISINNNLSFYSGLVNDIYTTSGDVRLQSRVGYGGNTIFNAGNNGNVGIGIYAPQYKMDVNGDARVSGIIYSKRITALPGDTLVAIGDSTIYFSTVSNKITHSTNSAVYKGLSIGTATSSGHGLNSLALGTGVWTTSNAINSIVMGSGAASTLRNDIPNSLMVGFNSNIPTLFVGASSGNNTVGKVGIGTTNPQYDLDVNGTINATQILQNGVPLVQWTSNGSDIFFDQNSLTGGSVGIGVAGNPSFFTCPTCTGGKILLAVDGGIRSKALKVEPLWSDYVFDSTYALLPLDQFQIILN